MSMYGSQQGLNRRAGSRGELAGGGFYSQGDMLPPGGGNGYDPYMDGSRTFTYSKSVKSSGGGGGGMASGVVRSGTMYSTASGMDGGGGGVMYGGGMRSMSHMTGGGGGGTMMSGTMSGVGSGMMTGGGMSAATLSGIHQRTMNLQGQCQEYLKKAEFALHSGSSSDAERFMMMAKETIEQLKSCALDLRQMGQPNDNVVRTLEQCKDQLKGVHMVMSGSMTRRRSTRGSGGGGGGGGGGGWEEPGRSFYDAMAWIAQQKRLIETAQWGDDPAAIEQQILSQQKFHNSIQRSVEMERARDDLMKKGDKGNLHALEQEWDSLQQLSFGRTQQLQDLQQIIQEISKEIMWVNDHEEKELVFDWGDKNIDQYIPKKQESYSNLMSALEEKEKHLNKLKGKVDVLLKNNHPAADKIEAYKDTLQTQWSWLLQITKCIDTHLKENAAYSQYFREAHETYAALQKQHESVRKKFTCDKNTSLEDLQELLSGLEMEKDKITEHKRQVQHLVNKSRTIVRLKPRNPEEKSSSSPIMVKALCDFKQDQKQICKDNEGILKDNSQRSKWGVTGPGGLDMLVPSVCLIIPPPNPLSISLANKNDQYYEAILSIWNQLYINVKSLLAWQYCLIDIRRINSLNMSILSKMRPDEYRLILKSLETHFEEFKRSSLGSQMFTDEDKRSIEGQYTGAQDHYDQLVVQLPTYVAQQGQEAAENQRQQQLLLQQQQAAAEAEARRLEEERRRAEQKRKAEVKKEVVSKEHAIKKDVVKVTRSEVGVRKKVSSFSSSSSRSLSELHALRLRLEAAEGSLSRHVHICIGDDGEHDCSFRITQLETVHRDIDSIRDEYLRLRELILKELEGMNDADKSQFLRSELSIINERLGSLESSSSAYLQRLRALRDMLESVARAEDIVKLHEMRLTERETTSVSTPEVEEHISALQDVKAELDQKQKVLASMQAELGNVSHWNGQVGGAFHRCDLMLLKYREQVELLSDRWRRIQGQIDTRIQDQQIYLPQLQHYKDTSSSFSDWIDVTRKKQNALQATKIDSVQMLHEHMNNQKALNSEIKSRRETLDSVLKDNEACVISVKDYESYLASYTSGLETLLNIPIKRTMLRSPAMDLHQEATQLQTRYMELLTFSGDYYKFLGELLRNMEELKIRNTRIDLLEEELRLLKDDMNDRNSTNRSLEDAVARYKLELSQSQDQLLSMEEVKQSATMQCSASKESLESTHGQLADLNDQVARLTYLLEEEKRKRRLAEERYTTQQEEYDSVLRKRQKELETVSWSKVELEKSLVSKDHDIEQLRRQLAEEAARIKDLQMEISKVRSLCSAEISNLKLSYESQIQVSRSDTQRLAAQRDDDTAELQLQYNRMEADRRNLEEELRRIRVSLCQVEEQKNRAEEEAHGQRLVITEEGRRRRELENQLEELMRERERENIQHKEELAEVINALQEKSEQLVYVTHSLEEETRRRKTAQEGQGVMEESLAQLQVKLTNSSVAATQLRECEEELQKIRMELEREGKDRIRVEQNLSRLQGRIKDLQSVRDELESQVEGLRKANQDEVAIRRQVEAELEKTTVTVKEYSSSIMALRVSQEQASASGRRCEEERGKLQEDLDRSLRQNKTSVEQVTKLSAELKALQQQLLQEQARVKEANLRNEGLYRTIEEKSEAVNESTTELQLLRTTTQTQTKERLRLEEELRAARHDREEALKAKRESDDMRRQVEGDLEKSTMMMNEYSSSITALRLSQEQASASGRRSEEERGKFREELDQSLRQNKTSVEQVTKLSAELKALQLQLLQEQAQVKEANLRNEGLYRTIEEKSKAVNETSTELQTLRTTTQTQTKERLRLEEELRASRQNKDEALRAKRESDNELSSQITALDLQLQASERSNVEYRNLVSELSAVREKLRLETDNIQKQASEMSAMMKSLQSQYNDLLKERDALLLKLQLSDKDKGRSQSLEDELSRIKLSLESELRSKQHLQDESERAKRDLSYWKEQSENKQSLIKQYDSDKDRMEREKNSLKSEIERLMRELRELEETFKNRLAAIQKELREVTIVRESMQTELKKAREAPTVDPSTLVFDGVRKPVTANQLLDCCVIDKPTFNQLSLGHKTVPDVSADKKISLKGTGPIAGVIMEGPKGPGSVSGPPTTMTFTEAKTENLLPADCVDLLLDAQAATGHIIDPRTNQKLTVEEACNQGVVDEEDRERLLAAEAAAVGYAGAGKNKPLSVFQAMKKGLTDKNTTLRLLQAQESVGGILDPVLSVFLPKDTARERDLIDDDTTRALSKRPALYLDPDTEEGVTYMAMKRICKVDPRTNLLLLPVSSKADSSKLVFDGVRKAVTAKQLHECGVLDKQTVKDLEKGKKSVPDVSKDKKVNLKGTGPIAGVIVENKGKISLSEAKKQMLLPTDCADLLLEAQAATGHIIDPKNNQKLTVDDACSRGVVDVKDRDKLLAAEAAAVGYKDPSSAKPLSVFEALKKGVIDGDTGLRLLQAQESAGGILDPILSVFLPKDTAIKRNLFDENLRKALSKSPACYLDPETEQNVSYGALKKQCKTEPHTGLLLLPVSEKQDPSKLIFEGVRKPVTAQQLLDCGVLDKPTFKALVKGDKTVPEVSKDKKVSLKGTGSIAGVAAGPLGKMSLTEAKKQMLMPVDSADFLLDAQAATGHIIDPTTNQKLTVEEACAKGVVDNRDRDRLLLAEAAAVGYRDPSTATPVSVSDAVKNGLIDRNTGIRLLQAQESAGGILDPNLSVFLPKETAVKRKLLDEDLCYALNQSPACYLDPDTEKDVTYGALKKKSKTESHTGLMLLPITERKDPSKLMFDGVRKPVSAQQLFECGVLDKPTFNQLVKGEKSVPTVSADKKVYLKGTGPIAGVDVGQQGKMSLSDAKKENILPEDSADLLLEAQAATGHIIDPKTNNKLTVEDAYAKGVIDNGERDRLLAAESAAVGYKDPRSGKPLSVFEAMQRGVVDKKTGLRLLQAQESVGGILDPNLSVFLPKTTAIKRNLLDEDMRQKLKQSPACYLDPETGNDVSYGTLKGKCKKEPDTGLQLLPVSERYDPSKILFDGVRKPVSAQQLFDCGVLDKPTFNQLVKGEKSVPAVSAEKKVYLKGTGPIAGVDAGRQGKISLSDAKKQNILPEECADLLLEAQAATGYIIDPKTNKKLTVEDARAKGVIDQKERDRLLAAEGAAVGYKDPSSGKPLSVFEAMMRGVVDKKTGLRLLQAQESVGGILDPNLSVFLPKTTAIKRNLLDEDLSRALKQSPACYLDPETGNDVTYGTLKGKCKKEPDTGLQLLPVSEGLDPSKILFDGVRKPVSAQQLLECDVLDKPTFNQLVKGQKSVPNVSADKQVYLKGTGIIAGVDAGRQGKMSLSEAKKQNLLPEDCADLLLEAQAATGYIIDPKTNNKLTVEDARAKGLIDKKERDRLLTAEGAAVGYKDPRSGKSLSVFEAMKRGVVDKKTGLRLLQAQESVGGILDPNLSVFLPKTMAIKRDLLDEDLSRALKQSPACYLDPETGNDISYETLKGKCKKEPGTGLQLLTVSEGLDPSKILFDGVRKPVSAQQLLDCEVLDKPTFNQLVKGQKSVPAVSADKQVYLKGTGIIAGVDAGRQGKMSLSDAKKQNILPEECANLLLEAQAATGYIIDPKTNNKLNVEDAHAKGMIDKQVRDRLLAAEGAAVGYKDPRSGKSLSVFEAMQRGVVDKKTGLRLLQAQESVGGILDPTLSVFLPKTTAIKRNLLDEDLSRALKQSPACYLDPETGNDISYGSLKGKCKKEPGTGLQILPVSEGLDPSKILFDGLRKPVSAQQLLECGVLDKLTFDKLVRGKKTIPEVSVDKKVFLGGTGSIAGVAAGPSKKMSLTEAKKKNIIPSECADLLLDAQAATGHIIDPRTNQKLTVKEASAKGVVDKEDESKLFAAEAAAIGYRDPTSAKLLSAGQAMRIGLIDKDTALRFLQAQESVGGILDPVLSVFLSKDSAMARGLIDDDLYQALNQSPKCYLDPDTQEETTYVSLKKKCKADPSTGALLIAEAIKPLTVHGLRGEVSVMDLVDANLLKQSDVDQLNKGTLTSQDIENRLRIYLRGSNCIAGVYDEANDRVLPIYQAMKEKLLRPGTTLELLEAQAASGFVIDPVDNLYLTVAEAYKKELLGPEFKDKLLSAERAVTGYKSPATGEILSLFQAIDVGIMERGHGIRLLEAQIASGGIIDPQHGHRIDVNVAYKKGYFDEKMNKILTEEDDDTKGFFDPNTEENLTYLELKRRCITDNKTGLTLLPIVDKKKLESTLKNTLRKRRVVIVDPETNKEMTVREAYDKGYIDHNTFLELSQQEGEWEEITITAPDGSVNLVIKDRKTGREFDINELLQRGVITQSHLAQYRSHCITLTQFADIIAERSKSGSSSGSIKSGTSSSVMSSTASRTSATPGTSSLQSSSSSVSKTSGSSGTSSMTSTTTMRTFESSGSSSMTSSSSSSVVPRPVSPLFSKMTTTRTTVTERSSAFGDVDQDSPDSLRHMSSVSISLATPVEAVGELDPVGAVFDTETLEKISVMEALDRGLMDAITAQRLLEAQACTGGVVNPTNGNRLGIQEASRLGIIDDNMATKLKPAQKAYIGYEDVKTRKKMSAALAMKEQWLPYEAGQRFLEFQYVTGGLYDPEVNCRRSLDDALKLGWLDVRAAQRLQDVRHHSKTLTCPKSKLKISYKDALDSCLVEEGSGVRMLQASTVSSRGISSPYNVSSAPGSTTGSRSGSRRGSRRGSVDLGSSTSSLSTRYFTSFSSAK